MARIQRVGGKRADGTYGGRTFVEAVHAARWIVDLTATDEDREVGLRAISWGVVKSAATRRVWMRAAAAVVAPLYRASVDTFGSPWPGNHRAIADVVNTYCNARERLGRSRAVEE